MLRVITLIILLSKFFATCAYAQDEFRIAQDKNVTNFELKITRITKDTLFYKAFGRKRFYLNSDLIGYRYKDSAWVYFNDSSRIEFEEAPFKEIEIFGQSKKLIVVLVHGGEFNDHELKFEKIAGDTLFYKEFRKHKYFLFKELLAYKIHAKNWVYLDKTYQENFIAQTDTQSIQFKLRQQLILKHKRTNARIFKLNSVNNYAVYFVDCKRSFDSKYLQKNKYVAFRIKSDSLGAIFVLPLIKIYMDTLYFDWGYFNKNFLMAFNLNELSYIDFEMTFPSPEIPIQKRKELEYSTELLEIAYKSIWGIWLDKDIVYTSRDIGF